MDSQARTGRWIVKEERGGGGVTYQTRASPRHYPTNPNLNPNPRPCLRSTK